MSSGHVSLRFGGVAANTGIRTPSLRRMGAAIAVLTAMGVGLFAMSGAFTSGVNNSGQPTPTAPLLAPAPTPVCDPAAVAVIDGDFDSCPTWMVDLSSHADGEFSDPFLQPYVGAPESNGEAQYYTGNANNLFVRNGLLNLKATTDAREGLRYSSVRLDTKGRKDFQYGRIVVRAKLPSGTGTWPAIWMLSSQEKYRAHNPAQSGDHDMADGEIDIAEAVGTEPGRIYAVAHSQTSWLGQRGGYFSTINVPDYDSAFHDYELRWTPTRLTFFVDGKQVYRADKPAGADYRDWPYDQPYYLIVNLALGGSWGGADRASFPEDGVDPAALPATMQVQSVVYYPYKGK